MDILFLAIIIFLFILAVFDLSVGVSNDAVNFLNSAIGSKAAGFRTIIIVASIGIFIGAASSNGMMDIARHGIFRPEHFSFYDLICIFMAVMVTDIIILDVFNSLGMPTSTTVSLVFELLGAAFIVALIKMATGESAVSIMEMLNTEKALSVIMGIFLSVAIAFVFGTIVQFIARLVFTFELKSNLKWKIGLFGGISTTAIIYFLLIKGVKDFTWVSPEFKLWIDQNTVAVVATCFVCFTLLMQALHAIGVNVLKTVVLLGTFALAMAFAGNDLVNFIGVPLTGLDSYADYTTNGAGDVSSYTMDVLNNPARTPIYFLLGAGAIMVVSLATSKKARNVTKTQNSLSSHGETDEMFNSSKISQRIVRIALSVHHAVKQIIPIRVRQCLDHRFDTSKMTLEEGASFDLIRGSVNLMLAGMLIALGTSMKLPLSTTFVTFMVAMGTSLADRAWGRESAVFRITGVISVIGGWFITAGVAFIGAAVIAALMHWGGVIAMISIALLTLAYLVYSNRKYKHKQKEEDNADQHFRTIISTPDKSKIWPMLKIYIAEQQQSYLNFAAEAYLQITDGFLNDDPGTLGKIDKSLYKEKNRLKTQRRKSTLCFRLTPIDTSIENSAWFHSVNNQMSEINYSLRRINEACKEHVENNFRPLPDEFRQQFIEIRNAIVQSLSQSTTLVDKENVEAVAIMRHNCYVIKDNISTTTRSIYTSLRSNSATHLTVIYLYLNILQESQEIISSLRKLLRASSKLNNSALPVRQYSLT